MFYAVAALVCLLFATLGYAGLSSKGGAQLSRFRASSPAPLKMPSDSRFMLGNEVLAFNQYKPLQGKRVGLLTNPSGVNRNRQTTLEVLFKAKGVKLVALFAAEHGISGNIPAGQEFADALHPTTKLPVYSLYGPGPTRKPTPAMLKGIDVLVYDLQDTGCRSYTFISSMGMAMESCALAGVEFMVLDRPNPLGGERVEGPMLNPRFRSMVGQWPIPYVYGMSAGELARMINGEKWIAKPCKLTVIPMSGWYRNMAWRDTGLPWVPTSPKITKGESPLHYVSTGILGSIGGVQIGFAYNMPFECVTAPWLDWRKLNAHLAQYRISGVQFQPFSINTGKSMQYGVRLVFSDPIHAPLTALNYYLLEAIKKTSGRDLFADAVKEGRNFSMLDKVNGTDSVRKDLMAGRAAANIVKSWKPGEDEFRAKRQRYLLYGLRKKV